MADLLRKSLPFRNVAAYWQQNTPATHGKLGNEGQLSDSSQQRKGHETAQISENLQLRVMHTLGIHEPEANFVVDFGVY